MLIARSEKFEFNSPAAPFISGIKQPPTMRRVRKWKVLAKANNFSGKAFFLLRFRVGKRKAEDAPTVPWFNGYANSESHRPKKVATTGDKKTSPQAFRRAARANIDATLSLSESGNMFKKQHPSSAGNNTDAKAKHFPSNKKWTKIAKSKNRKIHPRGFYCNRKAAIKRNDTDELVRLITKKACIPVAFKSEGNKRMLIPWMKDWKDMEGNGYGKANKSSKRVKTSEPESLASTKLTCEQRNEAKEQLLAQASALKKIFIAIVAKFPDLLCQPGTELYFLGRHFAALYSSGLFHIGAMENVRSKLLEALETVSDDAAADFVTTLTKLGQFEANCNTGECRDEGMGMPATEPIVAETEEKKGTGKISADHIAENVSSQDEAKKASSLTFAALPQNPPADDLQPCLRILRQMLIGVE